MSKTDSLAVPDPAATDETTRNARNGAAKRRDPGEPAAVVGLGASAGGVSVLQQFFGEMSPKSGLAFVVVMHLSPEHESNLAAILQQKTPMPVTQVTEAVRVRPDNVYVIPPNHQLIFEESMLRLVAPQQALGRRVTIDLFFRTLAQAYGQRAVCVVLSGTDSDGVIGLKHVRAQGGVTIVQDPNEAEYDSMPATAISTGMVDWVLPVAEMGPKLMEFVRNENAMRLPPENPATEEQDAKIDDAPGGETVSDETREQEDESALAEVLKYVRAQTGHDFSHYKRATVLRRIARRLQVNSLETIPQYLEFLRSHFAEARALLQDLLIGVTHFFRDREAFAVLEAHVPQIFAGKTKDDEIRVWVAGCASGEEPYSIAMLLCEHAERLSDPPSIQIFATDIADESLAEARQGVYPVTIEADVSTERLRRFFGKDHGRYRVRKDLREKVLFAPHNLLKDPPFSQIDLVSCRNLLIYLGAQAQEQVFDIFHFALRSGGMLFLGGAESESHAQALFSPVDKKHRLYVRRATPRAGWKLPMLPVRTPDPAGRRERTLPPLLRAGVEEAGADIPKSIHAGQERRSILFGELHLNLLEKYGPPSVVVNDTYDIVHLSDHAGPYLQFVGGEPSANLIKVVNPALQFELRTALFRAAQEKSAVTATPQSAEINGRSEVVTVHVRPMRSSDVAEAFYLVVFEKETEAAPAPSAPARPDALTGDLVAENQFLREQLNASVEQYEAANEELKASNEEHQAVNEEMRAAAEELETSKEELQSVNEELTTVNHELKGSVEELSRTNADLTNLMASTDIGTMFLDRKLRIQRFTPSAQKIFNLLPADLGRPLSDITHKLGFEGFMADAEEVLDQLTPIEREVRARDGAWFLTRIAPYRTGEDRIAGVVATFIDITRRKSAELELAGVSQELKNQLHKFGTVMKSVSDFIYHFDREGRFTYINQPLLDLWQKTHAETVGRNFHELGYPPELAKKLEGQIRRVIETRRPLKDETPYTSAIGERQYEYILSPLLAADGSVEGVAGVTRDITHRKQAEQALRESEARFRAMFEQTNVGIAHIDQEGRFSLVNPGFCAIIGYSEKQLRKMSVRDVTYFEDYPEEEALNRRLIAEEIPEYTLEKRFLQKGGEVEWGTMTATLARLDSGTPLYILAIVQMIGERKRAEEALRRSEERFRLLVEGARDYAMFLLDPGNVITFWSKGAERVFGWSQEEVVGQSGEMIFRPDERAKGEVEKELQTALTAGRAADRRTHLRKDGSLFWVDSVLVPLNDEQGRPSGFAKVARDASDQRASEDALRHARDEMEQRVIERTKDMLATNAKLEQTIAQRQLLEKELLEISEREKRRIGEDLHDGVCQELTATALLLKSAAQKVASEKPAAAARTLEEAAKLVNRNVGIARDLARGLQPVELKGSGLIGALRALVESACEKTQIQCEFKVGRGTRVADDTLALNLYRVAQEALTNAVKHSGARKILIALDHSRDHICVSVQDDGKGFSSRRRGKGLGLHLMRYRAHALGGKLKIEKRRTGGMKITCVIPVKR